MTKVELDRVTKLFEPSFTALDGISLSFARGEIHTILGENGAGKSTLMNILSGLARPTDGRILIDGGPVDFPSPDAALSLGIAMVHQRPLLSDDLSVLENILLGSPGFFLHRRRRRAEITALASLWDIRIRLSSHTRRLAPSDRLRTALLAALYRKPSFLILDEPTSVLAPEDRERFMKSLVKARDGGMGIIMITHKLDEAITWSDRISVLRHGKLVFSAPVNSSKASVATSASAVTAESLSVFFEKATASAGVPANTGVSANTGDRLPSPGANRETDPATETCNFTTASTDVPANPLSLTVSGLTSAQDDRLPIFDISFTADAGKITGIFGLPGSGIETLEIVLSGMRKPDSGTIEIGDNDCRTKVGGRFTTSQFRSLGIGFVPSDRAFRGSNPSLTIHEMLIANRMRGKKPHGRFSTSRFGAFRESADEKQFVKAILEQEGIDADPKREVKTLSGGQLQRLILERELSAFPRILILSEPEWGLDITGTDHLRKRLIAASKENMTILILTDSPDAMKGSDFYDTILYLDEGRLR